MLVILACTTGKGCPQTSSLYFSQNPQIKKDFDKDAANIREYVGPSIVDTVGPALFVVAGGTGTVKINKYFSLQFKRDTGMVTFRYDLP